MREYSFFITVKRTIVEGVEAGHMIQDSLSTLILLIYSGNSLLYSVGLAFYTNFHKIYLLGSEFEKLCTFGC